MPGQGLGRLDSPQLVDRGQGRSQSVLQPGYRPARTTVVAKPTLTIADRTLLVHEVIGPDLHDHDGSLTRSLSQDGAILPGEGLAITVQSRGH